MPDAKPTPLITEMVHFYDPHLVSRIGFAEGYGGMGKGPYAAVVVNNQSEGLDLYVFYPAKQPAFVQEKVRFRPSDEDLAKEAVPKPYWDWTSPTQAARAAKRAAA